MSKEQRPMKAPKRVRCVVLYEDTVDDGPRTWIVGKGTVVIDDVEVAESFPECNGEMAKAFAMRAVDEMELL